MLEFNYVFQNLFFKINFYDQGLYLFLKNDFNNILDYL
ncbi:hypothetical protein K683_0170 [Campylobacter jejuni HB-CJGB-LC]|nr:hypothetical protein K687_0626 [Campylobacter jejuni HB-CJGB-LL]KUY43278.1 hypothetical protein K683_0170 [Campylobacter jejuni HB-CJGB-LC]